MDEWVSERVEYVSQASIWSLCSVDGWVVYAIVLLHSAWVVWGIDKQACLRWKTFVERCLHLSCLYSQWSSRVLFFPSSQDLCDQPSEWMSVLVLMMDDGPWGDSLGLCNLPRNHPHPNNLIITIILLIVIHQNLIENNIIIIIKNYQVSNSHNPPSSKALSSVPRQRRCSTVAASLQNAHEPSPLACAR